MKGTHEVN